MSAQRPARRGGHQHGGHQHGHAVRTAANRRRLTKVLALTGSVMLAELVGGIWSGSIALVADAGHMLTDVVGVVLALTAARLAGRPADDARTWGYRRAEVLAAAAQSALLLAVGAFVLVESVLRLFSPQQVRLGTMAAFGVIALLGNAIGVVLLLGSRLDNLNMRAAFLEVASDAFGALGVLIAAAVIALTGWQRADAVASLLIAALIVPRTVRVLRESVAVLLESVPPGLDMAGVRTHLLGVRHVEAVHDLHVTQVATGLPVLTAHLVVRDRCFRDGHIPQLLDEVQECLTGHFDVEHSTIQFEAAEHAAHESTGHHES